MLEHDLFPYFEYLGQGQLGQLFGVSSQQVGRWLIELRLRGPREPSEESLANGLAKVVANDDVIFFSWHKERVIELLRKAGHRLASEPETPPLPTKLVGPFAARRSDEDGDGFEIADSDGMVAVWTRGETLAAKLAKLMTLAASDGWL
jgi:hypothetical protein